MDTTDDRQLARIRDAVDRLPSRPREVYRLSAAEGLDHHAIAERLGIGVEDVEALLAEAIVRIGRHLGPGVDG